ncbi:UDP-N-acetylmuramyl pentapeptide phosphotransferase [Brevibacillus sp. GCM10020057]|uniref:UDP-N-acetylmuramyl pentapeptide phosphotransferase n=1 Tax=Brevibacillus sp. GCM10020057 TaxID=3317327 RepID=UPI00363FBF88
MDTQRLVAAAIGLLLPAVIHRPLFAAVCKKLRERGMHRTNYRGRQVLTAGGTVIVCSAALSLAAMLLYLGAVGVDATTWREGALLGIGMIAVAFWGWQDDCSLDKLAKGFRGHFGMLLREGRVTSGMRKLWGVSGTSAVIALALLAPGPLRIGEWLPAACLLAISANALNLFDLRPARAIKVFWLLELIALGIGYSLTGTEYLYAHAVWQIPLLMATCLSFSHDACGRVMLGDTGSNTLGFCAGYSFVVGTPLSLQMTILLLLIGVHILAEFVSISALIERCGWLDWLDRWGRAKEAETIEEPGG